MRSRIEVLRGLTSRHCAKRVTHAAMKKQMRWSYGLAYVWFKQCANIAEKIVGALNDLLVIVMAKHKNEEVTLNDHEQRITGHQLCLNCMPHLSDCKSTYITWFVSDAINFYLNKNKLNSGKQRKISCTSWFTLYLHTYLAFNVATKKHDVWFKDTVTLQTGW